MSQNDILEIEKILSQVMNENDMSGVDEYCSEKKPYPECYAKLLNILYYEYKKSKSADIMEKARECLKKLMALAHEKNNELYWGLPFEWHGNKIDDGFLITTCFCIEAINHWVSEGLTEYGEVLKKCISWCSHLMFVDEKFSHKAFYYAPHIRSNIYNATSIAAGILSECDLSATEITNEDLGDVMKCILLAEKKGGYWNYSIVRSDVDLVHQCYVIEGMEKYIINCSDAKLASDLKAAVKRGMDFVEKKMKIYSHERYLFSLTDQERFKERIKHMVLKILKVFSTNGGHFKKARGWSYGSYIRALLGCGQNDENDYSKCLDECVSYVSKNLIGEGQVFYSADIHTEYIRHKMHLLEALKMVVSEKNY